MKYQYEVALSFAGEDRNYVKSVADYLKSNGIATFYDEFEEDQLLGKDLYTYLDEIYHKSSMFCVIFISKAYANKSWTNHERKSAQARDFINNNDTYILPARFDDTPIEGLRPTVAYIDLRNKSPFDFAKIIAMKVRGKRDQLLREAISKVVELTNGYLKPQSLATSDIIASEIRSIFQRTGYSSTPELLRPYFESASPSERLVGYMAYQTGPFMWVGEVFYAALQKELKLAEFENETRPMWQLLIAIALFASITTPEEQQLLNFDLRPVIDELRAITSADVDGQCKMKIMGLMNIYPWMNGNRSNFWGENYYTLRSYEFKWSNGQTTHSLKEAMDFVRCYPEVAQLHIIQGHFNPWHIINVPHTATTLDLAFAIAQEMVRNAKIIDY